MAYPPFHRPKSHNLPLLVSSSPVQGQESRRTVILQEGPEGHLLVLFGRLMIVSIGLSWIREKKGA